MKLKQFRNVTLGASMLFATAILGLVAQSSKAATQLYYNGAGNWNTGTPWNTLPTLLGTNEGWVSGADANVAYSIGGATIAVTGSPVVDAANFTAVGGVLAINVGTAINSGTLVMTGAGAINTLNGNTLVTILSGVNGAAANQALTYNGSGSVAITGSIGSNIGNVVNSGGGAGNQLILAGANSFTGSLTTSNGGETILNGSTTAVSSSNNLILTGSGSILIVQASNTAGTLTGAAGTSLDLSGATLTINESSATTFAGILAGAGGGLTVNASATSDTLTLSGTSTGYTGTTTVNGGAVVLATATNALGIAGANTVVNSGATVTLSGGISEASGFTLNGTGATSGFTGASATTTGALVNVSGTNTVSGAITTPSNAGTTIYAEAGSTLNLTGGINAAGGLIGNSVTFQTGVSSTLASSTATINVPSAIGNNLDQIIKTGPGNLNLSGSAGNTYESFPASLGGNVIQTVIQAGTITINADNQLGDANDLPIASSTALNGVQFNGGTLNVSNANTPTLAVTGNVNFEQNGGGGRYFTLTGPESQFNVSPGATATIANGQLVFGSTSNVLNQIGSGTLAIDTTNAITLAADTTVAAVGTGTTSVVGGGAVATTPAGIQSLASSGGILDTTLPTGSSATPVISILGAVTGTPSSTPTGAGGFPTAGSTVLVVNGLGDPTGANANGTINLGVAGHAFDSVVLNLSNQSSTNLIFAGTLTTSGDLDVRNLTGTSAFNPATNLYNNPLTLTGNNSFNGNVNISGAEVLVTGPNGSVSTALGNSTVPSPSPYGTFVFGQNTTDNTNPAGPSGLTPGQSAISPGILALSGGITVNNHITLVNNGILDNLSGTNTITSAVAVTFSGALPYITVSGANPLIGGSTNAQIGATAGTLILQNGIYGDPNSVTINGLNTDTGTVNVAGAIQSSVVNVVLGNTANTTNTVILGALNSYSGQTYLQGGNVIVGNNGAFSAGSVIVNAPTNLDSNVSGPSFISLPNNFTLTGAVTNTLTVGNQNDNLILAGTIGGTSGITKVGTGELVLSGTDNYYGATTVSAGILAVTGSIQNSTSVSVASGAFFGTLNANTLGGAATLTVSAGGQASLGGNESINTLKLDGTLTTAGNLTVITLSDATTGTTTGVLTINGNTLTAQQGTYDGEIIGANGNLVKNGGGTLTLNGDNSGLTGATTVNNGLLLLGTNSKLGSTTLAINTGGTVTTGAGTTLSATSINIATGATFNVNNTLAAAATVNDSGAFNVLSGSNVIANLNVTPTGFVTLSSSLTTGGLNGSGTINLNANTLTASNGLYNGLIYGTGNVTKAGAGILTLDGTNAFTGAANVTGGTLIAQTALDVSALNVSSGATYENVGGIINPAVVITNAGTTTLYGNQTAGSYTSNSGTLNGTGLLTAATYTLNGTSTVGNPSAFGLLSLGTGTLTSTGTVGLYANSAANTVNVTGGTLSAAGALGSPNAAVNISSGATLYMLLNPSLGYNGLIANTATVTNAGTLELSQNQTIAAYISNGGLLMGNGNTPVPVLTAATYALNNGSVLAASAGLGTGALTSNGAVTLNGNSLANSVAVQTGTLTVNAGLGSPNATVGISAGATLADNGNIVDTAAVTNAGTLTLGVSDTIATYTSNGGTLNGTGTLTAAATGTGVVDYALNNGSLVTGNANLGTGVLVSNGTVTIAGNSNVGAGTITVQTGTLSLTGTGTFGGDLTITINSGATLVDNGTINTAAAVTNVGTLTLNGSNQTVASYTSGDASGPGTVGDGLLNGSGVGTPYTLQAATYALNNNSVVAATAGLGTGALTSNGTVVLNGKSLANSVAVQTGTLTVNALLGSAGATIGISSGATLVDNNGSLVTSAAVTNTGKLTLGGTGNQTVSTYVSGDATGSTVGDGTLNGTGTLTATAAGTGVVDYKLLNNSNVASTVNLGTGTLTSNGTVTLSGNSAASAAAIQTGTLTASGTLGTATSTITVDSGATLASTGTLTYKLLQGSGTVTKTLLTNAGIINPGANTPELNPAYVQPTATAHYGVLTVNGGYNGGTGTLDIDLGGTGTAGTNFDQLKVTGAATFSGTDTIQMLKETNGYEMQFGDKVQIVNAGSYSGTVGSFNITQFTNEMLFDNTSGIVYGVGILQGQTLGQLPGLTPNSSNVANSLGSNAILPGNFVNGTTPMGATLLDVLASPSAEQAFNALSPESYAGFIDYGLHVTQAYAQAALNMPAVSGGSHVTGGSKDSAPTSVSNDTAVFAGYSHYSVGSSSSINGADYDINSNGGLAGVRHTFANVFTLGGFVGGDAGSVDTAYLHADSSGYLLGIFGAYTVEPQHAIQIVGSATYGHYDFTGTRSSLTGLANFHGGADNTFDIHLGVQGNAYSDDRFTLVPSVALDYLTSKMNAVNETGTISDLSVNGMNDDAFLGEVGVNAIYKIVSQFSLIGQLGYTHDFDKTSRTVNASFANGNPGTGFSVIAPGMGRDIVTVGLGGVYNVTDSFSLGLNYHADFGDNAKVANVVTLGGSFGF